MSTPRAWREVRAANAPCARSSHQLSAVGSVCYLFGGEDGPAQSHFGYGRPVPPTVHCLDVAAPGPAAWRELATTGTPPSPRLGHGQAVVTTGVRTEDGQDAPVFLYVFGGRQPTDPGAAYDGEEAITSLNDLHRLNLATLAWEQVACGGDAPSPRSYLQLVADGARLFVFGGMVGDQRYNDLYVCDTATHTWTRLPDAPVEGRGGAGVCALGGSIWVLAGFCGRAMSDACEYNVGAGTWRARADLALPAARSIFACVGVPAPGLGGPQIVAFGGELAPASGNGDAGKYSDETLLLRVGDGVQVVLAGATSGRFAVVDVVVVGLVLLLLLRVCV